MGLALKALTTFSILSLAHSIYSAYEATTLITPTSSHPQFPPQPTPIPLDIRLQTLISTFLLIICVVLSAPELRPIRWNEWAGRIEREGWDPNMESSGKGGNEGLKSKGGAGNPYQMLELRRGFWDVRGSRERFAGWVRSGEGR